VLGLETLGWIQHGRVGREGNVPQGVRQYQEGVLPLRTKP
jgi:hypothetical protein